MIKIMGVNVSFVSCCALAASLLLPLQAAHGWTVHASFDNKADDIQLFTGNLSSDVAFSPPYSARFLIQKGVENDGQHQYKLPTALYEGDELWVRVYLYVPPGFDWTASPITKLLRVAAANSDGSNRSYHSILATNGQYYSCGGTGKFGYMVTGAEMNPGNVCQNRNMDDEVFLTPGVWHSIELYIKVSATNGMMRAWHNGILKQEYPDPTIGPGGYLPADHTADWTVHHLLGWWNGGATQDQYIYFDNLVYTNERPSNQDAEGNYMIGPENYKGPVPPGTPTNINLNKVQ